MRKYYRTLRTSTTGRNFQILSDKMHECFNAQCVMSDKYGFPEWRSALWAVLGGISSVLFSKKPDVKLWKCKNGEYTPRCSNSAGKAIQADFDNMPQVTRSEVNKCIGWNESFDVIGVAFEDPNFFGCVVNSDKVKTMPDDCEEITASEYERLCKDNSDSE